jgi:type II restriction enzyme
MQIISHEAKVRRSLWVEKIGRSLDGFEANSSHIENALKQEIEAQGGSALLDHLRLCGSIPESYGHDSSEEKLYSKYTDCVLAESFRALGCRSLALKERADAADVEVFAEAYSFVADAKAFRLSRTAKNQKDFKIQALGGWKRGKPYAMVVCPIYQLPAQSSQIYQQASVRNVCIFTYSHLAMLVAFSNLEGAAASQKLLRQVFSIVPVLQPAKDAAAYWLAVNKTMLDFSEILESIWREEKQASMEAVAEAKQEALTFLAQEREKIMRLSHEEALAELMRVHKIESRLRIITAVSENRLLEIK